MMVTMMEKGNPTTIHWRVKQIMIDTKANADILFNHCYEQIKHTIPMTLRAYDHDSYSFDGKNGMTSKNIQATFRARR